MSAGDETSAIANAFLRDALEDRAHGELRSLQEYQARYPGHEMLIAREYGALGKRPPARSVPSVRAFTLNEYLQESAGDELERVDEFAGLLEDQASTLTRAPSELPGEGEYFGPYRILGEIGRGAQGVVLLG